MTEEDILELIRSDHWMMEVLSLVEKCALPDWFVGAGFVRGKVWDHLSGYEKRTPLSDIDVAYFDSSDKIQAKEVEKDLSKNMSGFEWEVVNQAIMHPYNNFPPFTSSKDALAHWVETATCVGVRLEKGALHLLAPYGISDLANMIVRPTPYFFDKMDIFKERQMRKRWKEKWPVLVVTEEEI